MEVSDFAQVREKLEKIGEKGMPDYLELTEEGMMFLR